MFYYVFDNLLQKYFKIKKTSAGAQKTIKSIDDFSESAVESDDYFEFESPVDIIGRE